MRNQISSTGIASRDRRRPTLCRGGFTVRSSHLLHASGGCSLRTGDDPPHRVLRVVLRRASFSVSVCSGIVFDSKRILEREGSRGEGNEPQIRRELVLARFSRASSSSFTAAQASSKRASVRAARLRAMEGGNSATEAVMLQAAGLQRRLRDAIERCPSHATTRDGRKERELLVTVGCVSSVSVRLE